MKTKIENINNKQAKQIKANNHEYLFWLDGSEISVEEIENNFRLVQYSDASLNLAHKKDDFRIEDILYFPTETTETPIKTTFTSFNEAEQAADDFFSENFNQKASVHRTKIGPNTYEFTSADDPALDDTFICKVVFPES